MTPPSPFKNPGASAEPHTGLTSPTGLAMAALIGITLAFYHRLWWPDLVLIKRDAFRAFPQIKHYAAERFSTGELPQWFPYEGLGHPLIGAAHAGVFHPFTGLYALLSPFEAFRAAALLSCLIAALGAFALGRALGLSRTGALLAGIAFTFSGYVVSLTENPVYQFSSCALPLFCAGIEKALRDGYAWTAAPAFVWAAVILNGDMQSGYYYLFVALLWTMTRSPLPWRASLLRLALTGCLAALLAGIQLGPTWTVFMSSDRAHPERFIDAALAWSTHPLRLVTVLASPVGEQVDPAVMARVFFENPIGGLFAESLYLGVPVVGLAMLGAWHRRDLRGLALLGGVATLLALGRFGGLYEIFYHAVPLWSAFRHPEKLMMVASFTVALLAGAGLDALRGGQARTAPWLVAALLCVTVWLGAHFGPAAEWMMETFSAPEAVAQAVAVSGSHAFLFSACTAVGVGLIIFVSRKHYVHEALVLFLLVTLITLDLARANIGVCRTGPAEAATFTPFLAQALQAREGPPALGRFRLVSLLEKTVVWPKPLVDRLGYYGAGSVERRQALDLEHNAEFHIEAVHPYLPGFNARLVEALRYTIGVEAAARLNVAYYIGRRYHMQNPLFAQTLVAELPPYDLALFRNPVPTRPRVYLSRRPERVVDPLDPTALFSRSDYLLGNVDVIESPAAPLPEPTAGGSAAITQYAPERVQVQTDTPQPAVLILLDAFAQGWTATLDGGAELPILRANTLVRAVVVPAGRHILTFSYQTPLLKAGAWASLTGGLLCLGLIVHARRRRCRLGSPA